MGKAGLREEKGCADAGGDAQVKLLGGRVESVIKTGRARIVDEDVDPSEAANGFCYEVRKL